jgi:hypothetical protein
MSYLSSFKDTQHYEGTSSIPPFEMCVPTSPPPRALSLHTLLHPLLGNRSYATRSFLVPHKDRVFTDSCTQIMSHPSFREPFAILHHRLSIPDF